MAKPKSEDQASAGKSFRITAGGAPSARCTLSTERNGTMIILKLSPRAADKVPALGWTHAVPEWRVDGGGKIVQLRISPPTDGERGYLISSSRRLRPHLLFPTRGVALAHRPVVLDEPVEEEGALVFVVPDGAVALPQADGGDRG